MERIDAFVSYLEGLARREDRAALARLRRGLGRRPGEAVEALPLVVPFLPSEPWQQDAFFLVATLFAYHPAPGGAGNFGATWRRLGDHDGLARRFVALLESHDDELGDRLRYAVALARSKGVAIDYRQLLNDVIRWGHPDRYVQLQWARSYWGEQRPCGEIHSNPQDA